MNRITRIFVYTMAALFSFHVGGYIGSKLLRKPIGKAPYVRFHDFRLNQAAIKRATQYTVLISDEGFGGIERGSGVLLDATHVLTCAHMVAADHEMWVYTYPLNRVIKASPVYTDQKHDLAVLELSTPTTAGVYAVFQDSVAVGEPITIIGNTEGSMLWFVSYGVISGTEGFYLLSDGLVRGGNSGGPWINDRGQIVALTDWGLETNGQPVGISGGISSETIHRFVKEWKHPKSIIELLFGN